MTEKVPFWQLCERAWAGYLAGAGHLVTRLADAKSPDGEDGAPLLQMGDKWYRAPDLFASKAGRSEYWEVKQRAAATVNRVTGELEYWVSYAAFSDYYEVARVSGSTVWVILYDSEVWKSNKKWMQADVSEIFARGERSTRIDGDGVEVEAWVWPKTLMNLVDGPEVQEVANHPILSAPENGQSALSDEVLVEIERELRRPRMEALPPKWAGIVDLMRENSRIGLEALRRSLNITESPRYSVMRVGLKGIDLDDVLGLMQYGIRVFLIASEKPLFGGDEQWIDACVASRLLEWAVVDGADKHSTWVVDGNITEETEKLVSTAGAEQPYNHGQFVIVHRSINEDILVRAGAGTGKTETMSERIMFLLATSDLHPDPRDPNHLFRLRMDEIVLVTFTRDAAREMRERIARTMMLRQRLCEQCVLPTIAWLLDLSNTEIETIHTYAKKLLQREGSRVGLGPGFRIGQQTMEFRRLLNESFSADLDTLMTSQNASDLPASHQLREFAERLWEKLSGNGFSPLAGALGANRTQAVWGTPPAGLVGQVSELLRQVLVTAAKTFADLCRRNQTLPVSELVSTSARAVSAAAGGLSRLPRYLFVDEFQDTDSEQIGMILEIRIASGASLFVVGDEKQGIYRFRGAEGNAFSQLIKAAKAQGINVVERTLTRNFRTGSLLLDSLHPFFAVWGKNEWLNYRKSDRLEATRGRAQSKKVAITNLQPRQVNAHVLKTVQSWLAAHTRAEERVAVLCRTNNQAKSYVNLLRQASISCEVRMGGDFYRTPAVQELRIFLEAVLNPADDAALLELCSTRWFAGLATMTQPADLKGKPIDVPEPEKQSWNQNLPEMMTWAERLSSLAESDSFDRADLNQLRNRLTSLGRLLEIKPTLGWLMDCNGWMQPQTVLLPDENPDDPVERLRYGRCFDHLITLLDENFADAPISPARLLEWLRLKIGTDQTEDEPDVAVDGVTRVTVLTVHKAKGLEYDRVVIPRTSSPFDDSNHREKYAIVSQDGQARLLWQWQPPRAKPVTNVQASDLGLWNKETMEKIREETRLLYVAMTRAREELEVVVSTRPSSSSNPECWADLLSVES